MSNKAIRIFLQHSDRVLNKNDPLRVMLRKVSREAKEIVKMPVVKLTPNQQKKYIKFLKLYENLNMTNYTNSNSNSNSNNNISFEGQHSITRKFANVLNINITNISNLAPKHYSARIPGRPYSNPRTFYFALKNNNLNAKIQLSNMIYGRTKN